jgi:outer membrane biosynthesis protein TonB
LSKSVDPDPHIMNADPKHCLEMILPLCYPKDDSPLHPLISALFFSTLEALKNFIWETVDPSRVGETEFQDTMVRVLGSLSTGMTGPAEKEYEECDCDTDPACICDEEEEEEDDEDNEEEEEGEEEEKAEEGEKEKREKDKSEQNEDAERKKETKEKTDETDTEKEIKKTVRSEEKTKKTRETTGMEKAKKKEKNQTLGDDTDVQEDENEIDILELEDESEILYRQKIAVFEERIRVLESLLAAETESATREVIEQLIQKARTEMGEVKEVDGAEVLGEAYHVLKAQIEEADRQKAKDEL